MYLRVAIRFGVFFAVVFFCLSNVLCSVGLEDLHTVKARLLASSVHSPSKSHLKYVASYVKQQSADGSWKKIDYKDKSRAKWLPNEHLNRLVLMSQVYRSGKLPVDQQTQLQKGMLQGFDFWVKTDPNSKNWWYNQIGAPITLYKFLLLSEQTLGEDRINKGCELLSRAKLGMTGQNLFWVAEIVIGRAALQDNFSLMKEAFKRVQKEIVVTTKEGIQPDFSFYQHGDQFYSGGYGRGFIGSGLNFAVLANKTGFAFSPGKLKILESYLLDGQQWLIRGSGFDYSASGRELSRPKSGSSKGLDGIAKRMADSGIFERTDELNSMAARIAQGGECKEAFIGHKHFWRVDYSAHHIPDMMASVRMTSKRLLQSEICNSENLLGEHLSDGVMYIYRRGDEYYNIFPVWNWKRLPGITSELDRPAKHINNRRRGACSFVGGVSDGICGVSAMNFERDGLAARKAWFFLEDSVVCLGAGISSVNDYRVITSINQCKAKGAVIFRGEDGIESILGQDVKLESPGWVYHDGIGYVIMDGASGIELSKADQKGSWKRISTPQSPKEISIPVFSLLLDHKNMPAGGHYAYVVTPQKNTDMLKRWLKHSKMRVPANTKNMQCVEDPVTLRVLAVFYGPGSVNSDFWGKISVNQPVLLSISDKNGSPHAYVSSPDCVEGNVDISIGKTRGNAVFPTGSMAGSSIEVIWE